MSWTFAVPQLENVSLRLMRDSDFDSARGIIRAIGSDRLGRDLRGWDDVFLAPNGLIWTALYGEAIVGFGAQSNYEDLVLFHSDIVHPDAQGLGIGTALVLARLATSNLLDRTRVGLVATEYSMSFYERFGFESVGEGESEPGNSFLLFPMEGEFEPEDSDEAWRILDESGVEVALDERESEG